MLRAMIRGYLIEAGYTVSETPDGTECWYHPTLGVRGFEDALIWQMTKEGAYGEQVSGWRSISVPMPVRARNSRVIAEAS